LMRFPDSDLMMAGLRVETDEAEFAAEAVTEVVESVVTAGNRVQERKSCSVEGPKVDAKAPDEIVYVVDVFLMGFRGQKAFAEPGATVGLLHVSVVQQGVDVVLDNRTFMDAAVSLIDGDGNAAAGVDTEFETEHGSTGTFGSKGVPVVANDG